MDESKEARVAQRMAAYRAVSPCATEALLATVVGAGLAVDGPVVLVDEVYTRRVGECGCHGGYMRQRVENGDAGGECSKNEGEGR